MREDGFLILSEDGGGGRRVKRTYKIDPEIIRSPTKGTPYIKSDGSVFEIPLNLLEGFFTWLEETYNEEDQKTLFIKSLETVRKFDYITFLMFLKDRAIEWENELAIAPRLAQLIEEYINELEKRSNIEPRFLNKFKKFLTTKNKYIISPLDPRSNEFGSEKAKVVKEEDKVE